MRSGGNLLRRLLVSLIFSLISISTISTHAAGPQTPSCGNYKVTNNEVIAGVKFPKGTYQINAFGIPCSKVMGSKGLFAQFLRLKDKDPLPKPWKYLEDAIGAPKFSSGPGVGFRVQLIAPALAPTPSPTPTTTPIKTPTPTPSPIPTTTPIETSEPKKSKYISSQSEFALATEIAIANVWAKAKPVPANYKIFVEPGWENAPYAVETQKLIQATVDFVTALGAPLTTDTRIFMPWNWSWVQKYADPKSYCFNATWVGGAYCGDGFHIQNLAHFNNFFKTGFEPLPSEPAIRQALLRQLSHELAHQSQADHLSKFERNTSFYPAWLREGAPEIISMAAYMKVFGISYLEVRDLYFNFTSPFCRNTKVSDLLMAGNAEYDCQGTNGVLATEALIATTGNFDSVYAFGASKIPQNGPRFFQDREGISDETYKFVMMEMYGIDIQKWHPIVDNYINIWATCSYERKDTNCKFIR